MNELCLRLEKYIKIDPQPIGFVPSETDWEDLQKLIHAIPSDFRWFLGKYGAGILCGYPRF